MTTDLEHWQGRLESHFGELAASRNTSAFPLFALEHGLSPDQLREISHLLQTRLAGGHRLSRHWLVWVVYAAEIGYGYTGEEYWQSFEEQTPGWQLHHRNSLRDWFKKFHATYHGVKPSGAWAANFPIIAWPITHAVLPKYLQYQFAHAIYQLRFQLAGVNNLDSVTGGRLLAAYAYDASTRFRQFLQQEELTGRILLGLLGVSRGNGRDPVYQPTLTRIVKDLDAVRSTRAWLKDARTVVVDRFKGIGQGSGSSTNRPEISSSNRRPDALTQLDIRPRLFLRHSGAGKWAVALDVPSFSLVAALQPDLATFLRQTRCKLAGSSDTKPAGWLLSHNRVGVLKSWPAAGAPLLAFEKQHAVLDSLLKADCVLSAGSLWLFRIGPDGIAREILGRTVRPGYDYIVASARDLPTENSLSTECKLDCSGIRARRICLPETLSADQTRWLSGAGLQVARTIRVWPSGLPCRGWDGEGRSEWLTTEAPCFGLVHDHPVSAYLIQLNGVTQKIVDASDVGVPTFIQLSPLAAGKHRLTVTAQRHNSIADIAQRSAPEGFLDLTVRDPEPWVPGVPAHTGLVVTVEPHDADLEDFWANRVSVSVAGPEGRQIACAVALERASGEEILHQEIGSAVSLPLAPDGWRKKFASFIEREEGMSWRYLEASAGRLHIRGGELGEFVTRFHRDVQPLRWLTRRVSGKVLLKLLDDSDLPDNAQCRSFSMENPAVGIAADTAELLTGIYLEPPGALYVARHGSHSDALVISHHGLARDGLQGLGVIPNFDKVADGSISLGTAISALDTWESARLAGPLADIRRTQVTRDLSSAIYARLCGKKWATAESAFLGSPSASATVDALQQRVCAMSGFGAAIKQDYARFLDDISRSSTWYGELARGFRVSNDRALCEFAIRLALAPQSLSRAFGSNLDRLCREAASHPEVVRGARFAALLCAHYAPVESQQFKRKQRWR